MIHLYRTLILEYCILAYCNASMMIIIVILMILKWYKAFDGSHVYYAQTKPATASAIA